LLAVLIAIGAAPTVPLLMMAVLSLGITASTFDVAVNSAATKRENQIGKPELSKLHGLGSVMASLHIALVTHFVMQAGPLALALYFGYSQLDPDDAGEVVEKKAFSQPGGPLQFLGAIGFLGSMAEGSIADWSGVYLKEHFGASDGLAPGGASMAYSGSLMGPPVIGAIAEAMGMQIAIAYIGGLAALIAFVASRSRLLK
jgi:hypothetical protein